jgi:nucleotide-binding universal stress UspA family protein
MQIQRILIPIDFSPSSLEALEFAVDFAKPFRAELLALAVIEPVYYVVPDYGAAHSAALTDLLAEQRRRARVELARLAQRYVKRRIGLRTLLQTGSPHQVIADTAKKAKADLILMATRGRTGLSRLFTGSVAERVVRTAHCPVLTLHAAEASARTARRAPKRPRRK